MCFHNSFFLHVLFQGGSPAPSLYWVRKGDSMVLDADVTPAADKEGQTVSLLKIVPSKVFGHFSKFLS